MGCRISETFNYTILNLAWLYESSLLGPAITFSLTKVNLKAHIHSIGYHLSHKPNHSYGQ